MPTLLGTWQRVSVDRDDDGNELNTETTTLTFTATHYFDRTVVSQGGVPFDDSDNAGTYTSTSETSLEKTFYIDDNDDGIAEEATIEKEYLFSGDSLFIHHWGSEHREENYNRFEASKTCHHPERQGYKAPGDDWDMGLTMSTPVERDFRSHIRA